MLIWISVTILHLHLHLRSVMQICMSLMNIWMLIGSRGFDWTDYSALFFCSCWFPKFPRSQVPTWQPWLAVKFADLLYYYIIFSYNSKRIITYHLDIIDTGKTSNEYIDIDQCGSICKESKKKCLNNRFPPSSSEYYILPRLLSASHHQHCRIGVSLKSANRR